MVRPTGEVIQCEDCGVYNDPIDTNMFQGEIAVCADRKNCKTRQQLRSKAIINNAGRRAMKQETTPIEVIDPDQFLHKAKALAAHAFNEDFPIDQLTRAAMPEDFYIVWFAKVLGNWKALVSTDIYAGAYFEVTYDGNKDQTYVDFYFKRSNICVTDEAFGALQTSWGV